MKAFSTKPIKEETKIHNGTESTSDQKKKKEKQKKKTGETYVMNSLTNIYF